MFVARRPLATSWLLAACLCLAGVARLSLAATRAKQESNELPANAEDLREEWRKLDDDELGEIVRDFGAHLKGTMSEQIEKLIGEVEQSAAGSHGKSRPSRLVSGELIRKVNEEVSEDIRTRIELAGDNKGALPQASLGQLAGPFVSQANSRLQQASGFIGSKIESLGARLGKRVPARLRRFFRWPSFLKFKIKHNKTYKSLREELYRGMLYLRTQVVVAVQHVRFLLRRDKHLLGATQFSDWTEAEYLERMHNSLGDEVFGPSKLADGFGPKLRAKLEQLAASGKNLQGVELAAAAAAAPPKAPKRRRKRSADELGEFEDDDEEGDLDEFEEASSQFGDDEGADEDDAKLLEEYANADLDALDEAEVVVDEALATNSNFVPVDLRDTGCVINPENQENCGYCYALATSAAASYYNCMDKPEGVARTPDRYHARFVSDCGKYLTEPDKPLVINGCKGGRMSQAFRFMRDVGVMPFFKYQCDYVSSMKDSDECAYPRPQRLAGDSFDKIRKVGYFQNSRLANLKLDEVDLHLRTIGPVLVNVRPWASFKQYSKGIYDGFDDAEQQTLHSMLVVGHDIDSRGRDYYIVLNSHGIVWGDYGFLSIYRESFDYFIASLAGILPEDEFV